MFIIRCGQRLLNPRSLLFALCDFRSIPSVCVSLTDDNMKYRGLGKWGSSLALDCCSLEAYRVVSCLNIYLASATNRFDFLSRLYPKLFGVVNLLYFGFDGLVCNSFSGRLVSSCLYLFLIARPLPASCPHTCRYRDEELELGEVVNFQIPVELNAGRRWLEAGQKLVSLRLEALSIAQRA